MNTANNPTTKTALLTALEANGLDDPAIPAAVGTLLATVTDHYSAEALFVQKNPKFAEGSAPTVNSERGELVDECLHALLALDYRSKFKVGMDGFGQHAGGLIVLNVDDDYSHLLVVKGDIYNKGKIGVIGGQGADVDKGDDLSAALREHGDELGGFPFDKARLFFLTQAHEWRTVDSRMDGYWLKSSFFIYLATGAEIAAMQDGYSLHVASTGGDPEIQSLATLSRREVLETVRDGKMGYYDQTQAFVMTALCIPLLREARSALLHLGIEYPAPSMVWGIARELALPEFKAITDLSEGDWRPKLVMEDFFPAHDD